MRDPVMQDLERHLRDKETWERHCDRHYPAAALSAWEHVLLCSDPVELLAECLNPAQTDAVRNALATCNPMTVGNALIAAISLHIKTTPLYKAKLQEYLEETFDGR